MQFHDHTWLSAAPLLGNLVALAALTLGLLRARHSLAVGGLVAFVAVSLLGVPLLAWSGKLAALAPLHASLPPDLVLRQSDAIVSAIVGLLAAAAAGIAALVVWRTSRRLPLFAATAALVMGLGAAALITLCLAVGIRSDRLLTSDPSVSAPSAVLKR